MFNPNNNTLQRVILCHKNIWILEIACLSFIENFLLVFFSKYIALLEPLFARKLKMGEKYEKIDLNKIFLLLFKSNLPKTNPHFSPSKKGVPSMQLLF